MEENELKAFNDVVNALKTMEKDRANTVLKSAITMLGLDATLGTPNRTQTPASSGPSSPSSVVNFSGDRDLTAKQFMLLKKPVTNIERIACLAYYLTHYKDTVHFKTLDLSRVNTEAAQPKMTNAAYFARDAVDAGYLAPAVKGKKQLSAAGEIFVSYLPDRIAAKEAMANANLRKKTPKKGKGPSTESKEKEK